MEGPSRIRRAGLIARAAAIVPAQRRFAYRSREAIQAAQSACVQEAVRHAYEYVPYYRETMRSLGLGPGDFRTAADLARLPLLDREQIQPDPEYFLSTAQPAASFRGKRTGGTSGRTLTHFRDRLSPIVEAAYGERFRSIVQRLAGKGLRYRQAAIDHPAHRNPFFYGTAGPLSARLIHLFTPRVQYSQADPFPTIVEQLNGFRPDVLTGIGSVLGPLFSYIDAERLRFHKPRVVIYGSDAMSEPARRLISDRFGAHVLSAYYSTEGGLVGFECESHLDHHLNDDICPVRIIDRDGRELPEGESGEVVISNLFNRGTVLLNYRLGDIARKLAGGCSCGRNLPRLSLVEGRVWDTLTSAAGDPVHPRLAQKVLITEPEVWGFQLTQEAPDRLSLALVAGPRCDRPAVERNLSKRLREVFGQQTSVTVSFVESLPRTKRGKVRPIIPMSR
jgi:phenylacetate-coenzyme A ligase PaaK-like adenylate-forming protein